MSEDLLDGRRKGRVCQVKVYHEEDLQDWKRRVLRVGCYYLFYFGLFYLFADESLNHHHEDW